MKRIYFLLIFTVLSALIGIQAQSETQSGISFKNAPVLFKKEGRMMQQILADIQSEKITDIEISVSGKPIQKSLITKGDNLILLTIPAVSSPKEVSILVKGDSKISGKYRFTINPVKKWEVYLVQHSHTDIGYTRPQSEILAEHMRYIDYALDYCDQTDAMPDEAKFRWTCESAWVTREYLRSRPSAQIERLKKRI